MALQHLRSSTANKRPVPGNMSDGQLGINTNDGSPGLFFKDSNNALVKVGPVHVGTTAPNASPASGGTAGNSVGEQWLDTTGGTYVFKVWDGSAWRSESGTFVDVNGDVMTGALGVIAGSAGSPGLYFSGDTNTGIYSPGADQVAISTGGVDRLAIDSSGRILVGASTAVASTPLLQVEQATGAEIALGRQDTSVVADDLMGGIGFWGRDTSGTAYTEQSSIKCFADGAHDPGTNPTRLVFSITVDGASSPTERMRIQADGLIRTLSATTSLEVRTQTNQGGTAVFQVANAVTDMTSGGALVFKIMGDGDAENANNSYTGISDIKLKENITDASSQWNDIKALSVKNYNFKEETGFSTHRQIGLIAQEVELVSPGLVGESPDRDEEGNDLGTATKSVNYSVLYMKAVKALQEAMERIEQLEQRLAAAGI